MLALNSVALALTLYVILLFAMAAWGDRKNAQWDQRPRARAWFYALSLGVYCTSWTFYGAVGEAARQGWDYLPIYLGPALVFALGFPLIRRLVRLGREHDTGSIADFLSARYGKSTQVAGLATLILTASIIPYIALQLKSSEASIGLVTGTSGERDWALLLTLAFSAFAIVFGVRHADTARRNTGLVMAIAFESLIKLGAMMAVGVLAFAIFLDWSPAQRSLAFQASSLTSPDIGVRFIVLTILAGCSALCLPRQFHMMAVELQKIGDETRSRWIFPAFLVLVALIAPPVALVGSSLLPTTNPDTFVLALPLALNHDALALLAIIGGFSAAAGMITISALAVSTMTVDALIAPLLLRSQIKPGQGGVVQLVLTLRRISVVVMVFVAYLFHKGLQAKLALADIGLVAFAGAAQLAPALIFGLYWRRANRIGALCGMSAGGLVWLGCVLVPAYTGYSFGFPPGWDQFSLMAGLSLLVNALVFIIAVAFTPSRLADRLQADAFTGGEAFTHGDDVPNARIADVEALLVHVIGPQEAAKALAELKKDIRRDLGAEDHLTLALTAQIEARLARAVGAAAARILITQVLAGTRVSPSDVVLLLDETAQKIRISQDALEETERSIQFYTDNVPALMTYADREEHIRFANQRYLDYFGLTSGVFGRKVSDYLDPGAYLQRKPYVEAALRGERQVFDIEGLGDDGSARTWQVIYQPRIEQGQVVGFFGLYLDVTARRRAEEGLRIANETLEEKVRARTAALEAESEMRLALVRDLEEARMQAEGATQSKTRFLAAASHDLLQPLSAARLLISALSNTLKKDEDHAQGLLTRIDQSITHADLLIRTLLDISRLDAGGVTPHLSVFALDPLIRETVAPLHDGAHEKGLSIHIVATKTWVCSDRGLMVSVLQNLVSNAVRYTQTGGIVVGVRRRGDMLALQVVDTGPGIKPELRAKIFNEFERGEHTRQDDRGLGLGLAIVERILARLDHPITIKDGPKGGSIFEILLPAGDPDIHIPAPKPRRIQKASLEGVRILCLDNDPSVLQALTSLLTGWGCFPIGAKTEAEARAAFEEGPPDLVILDFRLDQDETGPDVYERLCAHWLTRPPGIVATAERSEDVAEIVADAGLDLIHKPVAPASLRANLSAIWSQVRRAR
ncbi:hybrid sensor histidine kinase/response regulator [Woodsholea maritima]|uniref:hybrid sensor histidine kinase/response regulator n=1 Tax=Woodsholea maritima TaxID=240237 RepID=UPI00037B81B3|nr:ATP-binding protein [Woodsholea maritima]